MMDSNVYRLWKLITFLCLWRISKAVPENCYQELFSYSGSITSLNYPQPYPSGRNCTWVISTITEFRMQLMFETFDVENHTSCEYDYVTVFDGITDQDKVMGKFCGRQVPLPLISSKNAMRIVFVSDARVEGSGFKATYNTVMCGQNFNQFVGKLESPNFPENFMGYRKCIWTIETDEHLQVSLAFSHLDVSNSSDCSSEYLEIYSLSGENNTLPLGASDMSSSRNHLLTRICGQNATKQIINDIRSTSNKMYVLFVSEGPIQGIKFQASFTSDLDECAINNGGCEHVCKNSNGNFTCECPFGSILNPDRHSCKKECSYIYNTTGGNSFTSPNYPEKYPNDKVCHYLMHTTPSHRISLYFETFRFERLWDFVTVYDGNSSKSALFGNYTGYRSFSSFSPLQSSGNYFYIVFKSDHSYQEKGFQAYYNSICGGNLKASLSTGVIYSHPTYGQDKYKDDLDCSWKITSTNNRAIKLWFSEFELEYDGDCDNDYIEIYDIGGSSEKYRETFCGTKVADPFFSSTGGLRLRFVTNKSLRYQGFKAMYEIVP